MKLNIITVHSDERGTQVEENASPIQKKKLTDLKNDENQKALTLKELEDMIRKAQKNK